MKILVVGGTRYFGIPMVNALLAKGHDVTVATRGNTKVDFEGEVSYVILDRMDSSSVKRALENQKFDVIIEAYGEDFPFDKFDKEASALFHAKYDGGRLPMKRGVREILEYLKHSDKKIALATSTKKTSVIRRLTEAGLLEYYDEIVTGDMVTHSKPHPEIYLVACEKIGVKPEDAVAIEDSYNGIRSATSGGLRTIMVPDLLPANDEMKELAETVLNDLNDVIEYLDKM